MDEELSVLYPVLRAPDIWGQAILEGILLGSLEGSQALAPRIPKSNWTSISNWKVVAICTVPIPSSDQTTCHQEVLLSDP